jgi:hypothetical protein
MLTRIREQWALSGGGFAAFRAVRLSLTDHVSISVRLRLRGVASKLNERFRKG